MLFNDYDFIVNSEYYPFLFYTMYAFQTVSVFILVCACFNYNNLQIGSRVMKITSEYIKRNIHLLLIPILANALQVALFVTCLVLVMNLYSIGNLKPDT